MNLHTIAWWSSVAALSAASAIDIWARRIPNWITLPFFAGGVVAQGVSNGWQGLVTCFGGAILAFLLFAPACFRGWMGMGDLKLAAGVGVWIGPQQFLFAFLVTGMTGGVMAVAYSLGRAALRLPQQGPAPERTGAIPYAPAIAAGTLFSFFAQ